IAAWTRAVQLKDDAAGLAVAPMLKTLAPDLAADLNAYINATSPETRHAAGILLLLRWPGMRNHVPLAEEVGAYAETTPRDDIAKDAIGVNWWCGIEPALGRPAGPYEWWKEMPVSSLPNVNGTTTQAASPVFLSADDRTAMSAEWQRLTRLKSAPTYLATEAVAWAETRPRDAGVAEALARAVVATHYGCGDEQTGAASKRAFTILHARYATTTWAKQTPFWYEGR
ncbi:MAG: hypothetical protein KA205_07580, partial [Acidobacteria bacterium]|nr:hypothetical protein [Acidobacteriota bacterium]